MGQSRWKTCSQMLEGRDWNEYRGGERGGGGRGQGRRGGDGRGAGRGHLLQAEGGLEKVRGLGGRPRQGHVEGRDLGPVPVLEVGVILLWNVSRI